MTLFNSGFKTQLRTNNNTGLLFPFYFSTYGAMVWIILLVLLPILVQSCGLVGEQCVECNINQLETITTVQLKMVAPAVSPDTIIFTYRDMDLAAGANAPTIDSLRLLPNTYYYTTVLLYNEQKTPAENISKEIRFEGDQHQMFYLLKIYLILMKHLMTGMD